MSHPSGRERDMTMSVRNPVRVKLRTPCMRASPSLILFCLRPPDPRSNNAPDPRSKEPLWFNLNPEATTPLIPGVTYPPGSTWAPKQQLP